MLLIKHLYSQPRSFYRVKKLPLARGGEIRAKGHKGGWVFWCSRREFSCLAGTRAHNILFDTGISNNESTGISYGNHIISSWFEERIEDMVAVGRYSVLGLTFVVVCLVAVPGCQPGTGADDSSRSPDTLARAAYETYIRYGKAIRAGTVKSTHEIVPKAYWTDGIKALNPINVYLHRNNIVVVQRVSGAAEEGKYIYVPISSYIPQSGDDGFTFTEDTDGVYDFRRTIGN